MWLAFEILVGCGLGRFIINLENVAQWYSVNKTKAKKKGAISLDHRDGYPVCCTRHVAMMGARGCRTDPPRTWGLLEDTT
jgi:hypothetical protein